MRRIVLLAIATLVCVRSQTRINAPSIGCTGLAPGQIGVLIAAAPPFFVLCVQLDSARFVLDRTTVPFTLRVNLPASSASPVVEVPSGIIDGVNANFSLSSPPVVGFPVLVYRNGLLLTRCLSTTGCNGDYQTSGTAILFLNATQTAGAISALPAVGDLVQVVYWK